MNLLVCAPPQALAAEMSEGWELKGGEESRGEGDGRRVDAGRSG